MSDTRVLWLLLALGLSGWLLVLLAPVLTPFLIAALLAYVFNPLIQRFLLYSPTKYLLLKQRVLCEQLSQVLVLT